MVILVVGDDESIVVKSGHSFKNRKKLCVFSSAVLLVPFHHINLTWPINAIQTAQSFVLNNSIMGGEKIQSNHIDNHLIETFSVGQKKKNSRD